MLNLNFYGLPNLWRSRLVQRNGLYFVVDAVSGYSIASVPEVGRIESKLEMRLWRSRDKHAGHIGRIEQCVLRIDRQQRSGEPVASILLHLHRGHLQLHALAAAESNDLGGFGRRVPAVVLVLHQLLLVSRGCRPGARTRRIGFRTNRRQRYLRRRLACVALVPNLYTNNESECGCSCCQRDRPSKTEKRPPRSGACDYDRLGRRLRLGSVLLLQKSIDPLVQPGAR